MMIHGACDVEELGLHFVSMLGYVDGTEVRVTLDLGDMTDKDLCALIKVTLFERIERIRVSQGRKVSL